MGAPAGVPLACKAFKSSKVMGAWPETPPSVVCAVVVAVAAAAELSAAVVSAVGAADDIVVSAPADLADFLEAQPVRTTPAAMRENKTEILIFAVSLFMGIVKWLVNRRKKWFLSKT